MIKNYYFLDEAAKTLGREVRDLLHSAAGGEIALSVLLAGQKAKIQIWDADPETNEFACQQNEEELEAEVIELYELWPLNLNDAKRLEAETLERLYGVCKKDGSPNSMFIYYAFETPQEASKLKFVIDSETLEKLKIGESQTSESPNITTLDEERSTLNADAELENLFDPVGVSELEAMFPAGSKWVQWAGKAKANGLIDARHGRAKFNPYSAGKWWLKKQEPQGWSEERLMKVLAKNLPARSKDEQRRLTGDYD